MDRRYSTCSRSEKTFTQLTLVNVVLSLKTTSTAVKWHSLYRPQLRGGRRITECNVQPCGSIHFVIHATPSLSLTDLATFEEVFACHLESLMESLEPRWIILFTIDYFLRNNELTHSGQGSTFPSCTVQFRTPYRWRFSYVTPYPGTGPGIRVELVIPKKILWTDFGTDYDILTVNSNRCVEIMVGRQLLDYRTDLNPEDQAKFVG